MPSQVTIITGQRFNLVSHGNGLAYHLTSRAHPGDDGVFVQGEDAGTFREELDLLQAAHPYWLLDDILARLFEEWRPY